MRKAFTPEEAAEVVRLYQSGLTLNEVASRVGYSYGPVIRVLNEAGTSRHKPGKPSLWTGSDEQRRQVVDMYGSMSVRTIAARFHCRSTVITRVLSDAGVTVRLGGSRHRRFDEATAAEIRRLYESGSSLASLAARFDSNTITIKNTILRLGGTLRSMGREVFWTPDRIAEAVALYRSGVSQEKIAARMGVGQSPVSRVLFNAGVTTRSPRVRGEGHHAWKGGRFVRSGYAYVAPTPDDLPFATPLANGYVAEHRLVMGRMLGRKLGSHETVHHINGDKTDNRPGNLQLRQGKHGTGVAHRCLDCGSTNVAAVPLS